MERSMDEIKKPTQNENLGEHREGGRRRRHGKKRGGNKVQNNQVQQEKKQVQAGEGFVPDRQAFAQQVEQAQQKKQHGNKQKGQKPAQPQNQKQPVQNQQQNQKKKNKQNNQNNQEDNRKDTYLYTVDGNLYVNLTNKCSNGCDFCVRNERTSYYGNYLWLKKGEPTVEKVIAQANGFGDLTRFKEVVFCGFGEPTYKVAEMVALCDYFHEKGLKTRLNTNGQGNLINKRDIVPELKDKIDFVNISLNASCAEKYQKICRSQFREAGFDGMIEFAKTCKRNGVPCRFSIVDCIGEEEVEACKRLAASVNVPLYIRDYITDS